MDYVVIVAGGKGTRMGGDLPKQFLPLEGKPLLMRTIERFYEYSHELNIIVVLHHDMQDYWRELCKKYHFSIPHKVADGGATRFESSKSGLSLIPDNEDGAVAFHDGVRPFVSKDVIAHCFDMAHEEYTAVPVMPVVETLRHVDDRDGSSFTVDRKMYRSVQTPQVFDISLAKQAFNQPDRKTFTDDASVIESLGVRVNTVEGNRENIKITTPFDMKIAEVLINS